MFRVKRFIEDKTQAVILEQQKSNQNITITKADILSNINPLVKNLKFSKIKSVEDSRIVIDCNSQTDNMKFVQRLS